MKQFPYTQLLRLRGKLEELEALLSGANPPAGDPRGQLPRIALLGMRNALRAELLLAEAEWGSQAPRRRGRAA